MLTYTASATGLVIALDGIVHVIPHTDNRFKTLRRLLQQGDEAGLHYQLNSELRRVLETLLGPCPSCGAVMGADSYHNGDRWYCSESCVPQFSPP